MSSSGGAPPRTPGPAGTTSTPAGFRSTPGAGGGIKSSEIAESRFPPGAILAGRYRILSLLGRGGMGEVYRADDLTLGQQVALKFLPEALASDPAGLASFHNEVRLARQIAHPNICRVYDIGSLDGLNFLSMEYVDGEDLASLLRRIGRLPAPKALEIARQLCLGLAAAHEQGVLHRDLKPANVMIDGRGQARLMDFGLAGIADRMTEADVFAGTPSSMAPEQLAGIEVTVRSDIYSLGLLLYEMVTGAPAFRSDSLVELIRLHQEEPPKPPAQVVEGVDPQMERAILACLAKDPAGRPPSALALSAMLPGGDPLAAALAAGQTPSPEMVAEAGGATGALSLRTAWLALGGLLALLLALLGLDSSTPVYRRGPLPKPPAVLVDRAMEVLKSAGYSTTGRMTGYGFELQREVLTWMAKNRRGPERWKSLESGATPAVSFWYRANGEQENVWNWRSLGRMKWDDPPSAGVDNALVRLDPAGRLRSLIIMPPFFDTLKAGPGVNWAPWFAAAGFDTARFHVIAPPVIPRTFADELHAWEGTLAEEPDTKLMVQGAALRGRPVQFRVLQPWEMAMASPAEPPSAAARTMNSILSGILILAVVGGGYALGIRNARRQNADQRGASRLAWTIYVCCMVAWVAGAHHFSEMQLEINSLVSATATSLLMFGFTWGVYMAFEPTVRRVWPQLLIGWTRLLSGRLRDPLVGRDILVGAGCALAYLTLRTIARLILWKTSGALPQLDGFEANTLLGGGYLVHLLAMSVFQTLQLPMLMLLAMVVLSLAVRNRPLAIGIAGVLFIGPALLNGSAFDRIDNAFLQSMLFVLLLRCGLLTMVVSLTLLGLMTVYPVTLDVSAWYFPSSLFAIVVAVLILLYGFRTALGAQKPFGRGLLQE